MYFTILERVMKCLNSDSKKFSIKNEQKEHFVKINNSSTMPSANPMYVMYYYYLNYHIDYLFMFVFV